MREYHVDIMTNGTRTLYIGVTNDLVRRMSEHKQILTGGVTKNTTYPCLFPTILPAVNIEAALTREKQLTDWLRNRKMSLIEMMNPECIDLSAEWYDSDSV